MSDKVTELSKLLNTFRPQLKGKDISAVEINKILQTEADRELRKEAYLARTQINKHLVDQGFIDLLKMRNEYAQLNGFKNFVEYRLDGDELNIDLFKDWKEQASKGKEERLAIKQKLGQKHLGIDQVMPWDGFMLSEKMFPYSQKEVDMLSFYKPIRDLFSKFGFDIDSMNITYDVYSRKNKSEWGYNFTIENGKDSRILANIKNEYTYFNVMLHETGHAVHSFSTNPDDFLMNSGISGIISEGIANLFGSFTKEEIFYKQFFSAEELPAIAEQMHEAKEYGQLNKLRSVDEILFDQHLYLEDVKSLADINDLKWKFRKDVHGTGAYPGEDEPIWGYTIHHTTHPIYLHNYLMGTISYEMLKSAFCQRFNKKDIMEAPLEFGNFLRKEVMEVSGRYPYPELVKRFSGKEFSLV
jgi:oligoendopeptidase F